MPHVSRTLLKKFLVGFPYFCLSVWGAFFQYGETVHCTESGWDQHLTYGRGFSWSKLRPNEADRQRLFERPIAHRMHFGAFWAHRKYILCVWDDRSITLSPHTCVFSWGGSPFKKPILMIACTVAFGKNKQPSQCCLVCWKKLQLYSLFPESIPILRILQIIYWLLVWWCDFTTFWPYPKKTLQVKLFWKSDIIIKIHLLGKEREVVYTSPVQCPVVSCLPAWTCKSNRPYWLTFLLYAPPWHILEDHWIKNRQKTAVAPFVLSGCECQLMSCRIVGMNFFTPVWL